MLILLACNDTYRNILMILSMLFDIFNGTLSEQCYIPAHDA